MAKNRIASPHLILAENSGKKIAREETRKTVSRTGPRISSPGHPAQNDLYGLISKPLQDPIKYLIKGFLMLYKLF